MNVALQKPWNAERFLDWVSGQDGRFEFDGSGPVAMTGGNAHHSAITGNIITALKTRLRGTGCSTFGPDLGIRTVGENVRFPDALVTCSKFPGSDLVASDPIVVFEVLSPSSGRTDRIAKIREYAAVPSIRLYVIVESRYPGLLVLSRKASEEDWTAMALTLDDVLEIKRPGLTIPVSEFYSEIDFGNLPDGAAD